MTRAKGIDPAIIHVFLKRCEQNHWSKTYMALLGGALLSMVGPLVITLSFLIISLSLIMTYGFWLTYLIIAVISLPIMFLVARYVQGSVLEHAIGDGDSVGRGFLARGLIIVEIANIGPRLVLWGIEQMRGRKRMGEVETARLAEAVATLSQTDGGIPVAQLLKPGESADHLAPLLAVLLYYDIADISKAGDRIWLSSVARQQIQAVASGRARVRAERKGD
jgi:hypothetical protein